MNIINELGNLYDDVTKIILEYKQEFEYREIIEKYNENWKKLFENEKLEERFIEIYFEKISYYNWYDIMRNNGNKLSYNIYKKGIESGKIELSSFFSLVTPTEKYFEQIFDVENDKHTMDKALRYSNLENISCEFFERQYYAGKFLLWEYISWNKRNMSINFIEKFRNKVYWVAISRRCKLPEYFISKHKKRVCWKNISKFQTLSHEFMKKHKSKINWGLISRYQNLTEEFMEEFKDKLYWNDICRGKTILSNEFIEKHIDRINFKYLSSKENLTIENMEKFKDKLDWREISMKCELTIDKLEHVQTHIKWYYFFCGSSHVTEEILIKYNNKIVIYGREHIEHLRCKSSIDKKLLKKYFNIW